MLTLTANGLAEAKFGGGAEPAVERWSVEFYRHFGARSNTNSSRFGGNFDAPKSCRVRVVFGDVPACT